MKSALITGITGQDGAFFGPQIAGGRQSKSVKLVISDTYGLY